MSEHIYSLAATILPKKMRAVEENIILNAYTAKAEAKAQPKTKEDTLNEHQAAVIGLLDKYAKKKTIGREQIISEYQDLITNIFAQLSRSLDATIPNYEAMK